MPRYIKEKFDPVTLEIIAEFICGDDDERFPIYRSSSHLTPFFKNIGINVVHDGSTRKWWVLDVLNSLSLDDLEKVILRLVDIREYKGDKVLLDTACSAMTDILFMENMSVFFEGRDPVIVPLQKQKNPIIKTNQDFDDVSEEEFLKKDFEENDITKIGLDSVIEAILKERIQEAQKCVNNKIWLSAIFMTGSSLEGLLLGVASKYPKQFNQAKATPKSNKKVKPYDKWTLAEFINVAYELNFLGLDVKKFSHAMRDFRNYIHPYQ